MLRRLRMKTPNEAAGRSYLLKVEGFVASFCRQLQRSVHFHHNLKVHFKGGRAGEMLQRVKVLTAQARRPEFKSQAPL